MRNLSISSFEERLIEDDLPLTATAWDLSDDSMICAFGPSPGEPTIRLQRKRSTISATEDRSTGDVANFEFITSWDAPCPLADLESDEILLMHHFSDLAATCLVLAGGDLVFVRHEPLEGQEAIEIVGSIDVGIAAAAWAPDEEVLAIVTRADNLILMSRLLEPLSEVSMTAADLQASRHVSVGWGKKETQFQGKRAKAMRDPTMPDQVDEGQFSPFEDNAVSISWRGDGAYVAINSVVPALRRVIRIFSRDGILDSVSEPVDGLESALSWIPAGNLVASVKRSIAVSDKQKIEVIFFERNGLRHGQFELKFQDSLSDSQTKKTKLGWNSDSSVLAISFLDSVQFWTMGNYHYYLKQEVKLFSEESQRAAVNVNWHPEQSLRCSLQNTQKLMMLSYELQVSRGSTIMPFDNGTVAVIDGRNLKITPLRQAVVPPPMSFCEIQTETNITDCAISRDGTLIAILDQTDLRVHRWQTQSKPHDSSKRVFSFTTNFEKILSITLSDIFKNQRQCLKVCICSDSHIFVLSPPQNGLPAECYKFDLDSSSPLASPVAVPALAQNLRADMQQRTIWASDDSSMYLVEPVSGGLGSAVSKFPASSSSSAIILHTDHATQVPASVSYDGITSHLRLKPNGMLSFNERVISQDCTSFAVTDSHLIFTTAQHYLKFFHLKASDLLEVPEDVTDTDERCRVVERGAKIVTVIPSIYAVVLQMPRGNLETIYPRALVVVGIRGHLEQHNYRAAFLACQVHQVDMNILYDHLPGAFMENISKFIDDLRKPSRIDEFLSKLREEDVTMTLYKDTLKINERTPALTEDRREPGSQAVNGSPQKFEKVNQICDSFIAILNTKDPKYLTSIITAHVCKKPPDLNAALMLISSLRKSSEEEADIAVAHLCFLTDTNRLYDAALGLYDLDLTLLVAQNAQRDPREYMPFLQSLQALSTLRRQYEIDNHLKQYSKALISLHSLKVHDEVESYTVRHSLYTTALNLYRYDTEHLAKITTIYAEYLENQSKFAAAATLRESLGEYNLAYPLYALAHLWRESLACASLVPLEHSKLISLANALATTCAEESRDYRSAAAIYVDYIKDIHTASRLLCKGSYFAEATRLLALHNLSDDISTVIDPGLTEKFGEIVELVADCKAQLAAQVPRINELRKKKEEDPLAFYGGDAAAMTADGIDIPDNVSLAPTDATTAGGQSLFTRYGSNASKFGGTVASNVSRKTSKTKRREERKRARGKKGSVYEEEYLIGSVARLIERINGIQDEVNRLINGMLRRGLREQSEKVDEIMRDICGLCEKARREVWQVLDEITLRDEELEITREPDGQGRPSGADGVLWDSQHQIASANKKQAPMVKSWSGSSLILR